MSKKYEALIRRVSAIAEKNQDIRGSIERICLAWTDGKSDSLSGAYEHISNNRPDELKVFMDVLAWMERVYRNHCVDELSENNNEEKNRNAKGGE